MKKITLAIIFLAVGLSSLTGCSSIYYRNKTAYRHSRSVPKLILPAGYSNAKMQDYYVVPPVPPGTKTKVSLLPPRSLAAQKAWAKKTNRRYAKNSRRYVNSH